MQLIPLGPLEGTTLEPPTAHHHRDLRGQRAQNLGCMQLIILFGPLKGTTLEPPTAHHHHCDLRGQRAQNLGC